MLCKKLVFSVTYLIAVFRPHYLPVYVRECKLLSGKRTEHTAVTLHCVLLSQFNIQIQIIHIVVGKLLCYTLLQTVTLKIHGP